MQWNGNTIRRLEQTVIDGGTVDLASSTETITGTSTTKAVTPSGNAAALPWVNLAKYATSGVGGAQGAQIQAAFTAAAGGTLMVPPGTWDLGTTDVTFGCSIDMKIGASFSYSGTGTALKLDTTSYATITNLTIVRDSIGWDGGGDTTSVGLQIYNSNVVQINRPTIKQFYRGLNFHGEVVGSSYCTVDTPELNDNMIGLAMTNDAGDVGWANSNTVKGGRIRINSGHSGVAGSRYVDATETGNGLTLFGVTLEAGTPEWTADVSQINVAFIHCRWETATGIRSNTGGHVIVDFGYGNLGEGSATGVPMTRNGGGFSTLSSAGSRLSFDGGGNGTGKGLELVGTNATTNIILTARDNADLTRAELQANGTYSVWRTGGKGGGSFPDPSVVIDGINRKVWVGDGASGSPIGFIQGVSATRADLGPSTVIWRTLGGLEIDGNLDHDGSAVGFYGTTPVARPTSTTPRVALNNTGLGLTLVDVRVGTVASSATPTINTDNVELFRITALAAAITSMTTNLSGTPADGQRLQIAITDNGTARAITWGASFEASTVALPTTTVISTRLDVEFIWNTVTTKWRCIRVS